jgi:hypothetical protein
MVTGSKLLSTRSIEYVGKISDESDRKENYFTNLFVYKFIKLNQGL